MTNLKTHWYILNVYSGFEEKVAQTIREKAIKAGMADYIEKVVVPTEDVVEVRRGKKVNSEKKFLPGYVLIKMVMDDNAWHLIKEIPRVTGFLGGGGNKPAPISESEASRIFTQIEEGVTSQDDVMYEVGEAVKVIDGPFADFIGVVEEIDTERARLKVGVSIFGRSTPVELEYTQVEKTE